MPLPKNPTLTWLLSFWCSVHAVLALLVGISGALSGWPASIVLLAAIAAAAAAGAFCLRIVAVLYRHWNRVASLYSSLVRAGLTGASFAVVASASSMRRRGELPSMATLHSSWRRKPTSGVDTYDPVHGPVAASAWISRYVAWARRSDNLWALCLLPFVLLLLAIDKKEDAGMPDRLYTLY